MRNSAYTNNHQDNQHNAFIGKKIYHQTTKHSDLGLQQKIQHFSNKTWVLWNCLSYSLMMMSLFILFIRQTCMSNMTVVIIALIPTAMTSEPFWHFSYYLATIPMPCGPMYWERSINRRNEAVTGSRSYKHVLSSPGWHQYARSLWQAGLN